MRSNTTPHQRALDVAAEKKAEEAAREERKRVSLVQPGAAVTLRSKVDGIETWHRVERVVLRARGKWALYVGGLSVRYPSEEYEFVRIEETPTRIW